MSSRKQEELAGLISLKALGLDNPDDNMRIQELTERGGESESMLVEIDDLLAESVALGNVVTQPSALLRERVMVSTEPELAKVVTDASCEIVAISRGFSELCGYKLEEIRGKKPGSFLQGSGTDPAAVEQFRHALANQTSCTVELLNYHKSGSPYWVHIEMSPILERNGQLQGFSAIEKRLD